jgi:GntR family transcriptional regulator, arabinose operon transcriptional repressor
MLVYKYQQIIDIMVEEIRSGTRKRGDRLPDVEELDDKFSTSSITVNRALNELQKMGYIQRVKGKGTFIVGIPSMPTENSSQLANRFISCIIPFDLHQDDVMRGIESTCRERSLLFTTKNSNFSIDLERESLIQARENGAAGIIVYPVSNRENIDLYSRMIIENYPFVIIDRSLGALTHPFVCCANLDAFNLVTEHLITKGHRRIGYLCGDLSLSSTYERFQGYCAALIKAGIPVDGDLVIDHFYVHGDTPDEAVVRDILKRYVSKPINATAIACANDFIASRLIQQAETMGIRVPADLSITGFDNLYFTSLLKPPLTTVIQPFKEIGENATRLLADMIESKMMIMKTIWCRASIIERASVAAIEPAHETPLA